MDVPNYQSHTEASRRAWLLGALRVENAQGPIRITGGKAQSLFAFLVLHPATPHPREVLADRLWPEVTPNRVRRNLSDALYRLRGVLGPGWLVVERDRVALQVGPDLWVDIWEFERLSQTDDLAALERVVALYTGDLLPEIYDDWILARRVALHEKYLTSLLRLGQAAEQRDQSEAAYQYYLRLAHDDPLREEAHRGLMRSLAHMGRLKDALDAYANLEALLHQELGVQPDADTRALAEKLRSELELAKDVSIQRRGDPTQPPFVGRKAERDNLLETNAGLALVCLVEGNLNRAQVYLQDALQALDAQHDRPALRQWVHYAAYCIRDAQGQSKTARQHLCQAAAAMLEVADTLVPEEREQFLRQVPLNQKTQAALVDLARRIQVRLVRAEVPLGRKLTETDYTQVIWTVYAPEDDLLPKPVLRRRYVLKRLLAEAAEQGAAPTDDDLATALGVSRRTVLRDMEALAKSGQKIPTRRRGRGS
jgi:DNA-binding SARP family transcriptional activator